MMFVMSIVFIGLLVPACTSTSPAGPTACSASFIAQADEPAALRSSARDCATGGQEDLLVAALPAGR